MQNVHRITNILWVLSILLIAQAGTAQKWQEISDKGLQERNLERQIIPTSYKTFQVDISAVRRQLVAAPDRFRSDSKGIKLLLPNTDGVTDGYELYRSDVFHPNLAARYPQIQSYSGVSVDGLATIKLSISQKGLNAMIMHANGTASYIDQYALGTANTYIVYNKADYEKELHGMDGTCSVEHAPRSEDEVTTARFGDCQLRKYRLALACTGEYATFHGGTTESVLAEYNVSINRVNGIYEKDFGIIMELIENTDELIFFDGATDPYTNDDGFTMLSENQSTVTSIIGAANYDIGHVYSTGGGGIASLRSPCTNRKARGVTGLFNPVNDPFYVDYVAHEIGHQFGCNHTFNNECGFGGAPNRNDETAYEPGSGTTIMSYAGICAPDIQNNSSPYFHAASLLEAANFVVAGQGDCAEIIDMENAGPEIESVIGHNAILPISTPFMLSAIASDDDDDDVLTYCWEQYDNQISAQPPVVEADDGPSFRSYSPVEDPTRLFPRLLSILYTDNSNTWERLPSVDREMNFRLSVRDNHQGLGCTANDEVSLTFTSEAGPFEVTSQSSTTNWTAGEEHEIIWDVANTDQAPISCGTVDIILSIDRGENFDIILAEGIPNNGSAMITVPPVVGQRCRVMVRCATSIFFDVNGIDIRITSPFTITAEQDERSICQGESTTYDLEYNRINNDEGDVTFTVDGLPTGADFSFDPMVASDDANVVLTVTTESTTPPGAYPLTINGTSSGNTISTDVTLNILSTDLQPLADPAPVDGAINQSTATVLSWQPQAGVPSYEYQVSASPSFTDITRSGQVTESQVIITGLSTATVYYWRARPISSCAELDYSSSWSFQTGASNCELSTENPDLTINSNDEWVGSSVIALSDDRTLTEVEVSLNIEHSYVGDLSARLIAPDGTSLPLFDRVGVPASEFGCDGQDLELTFSDNTNDDASVLESLCGDQSPSLAGTYQPISQLATLSGKTIAGDWTLEVSDAAAPDGGTLVEWSILTCALADIAPGVIINNNPLQLVSQTQGTITEDLLAVQAALPQDVQYILRSIPENGTLELTEEDFVVTLAVGDRFTQEDVNELRLNYILNQAVSSNDQFVFDTEDDQNRYTSNNVFLINATFGELSVIAQETQSILCFGDSTAEITASSGGGLSPYEYSLNDGPFQTSTIFSNLGAGTYTVTIKDSQGEEATSAPLEIMQPNQLEASILIGINEITIGPSGGAGGYMYSLDGVNYSSINVITVANGETYTFFIRDQNGCVLELQEYEYFLISDVEISVTDVDCKNDETGMLEVISVEGGKEPYLYALGPAYPPQPSPVFADLPAGNYGLDVIDSAGNVFEKSFEIKEPDSALGLDITQEGNMITAQGLGGTPSYLYSLNGMVPTVENVFNDLPDGEHIITVTDANGCERTSEGIVVNTATKDPFIENLTVYPNPTTGQIFIEAGSNFSINYKIYNSAGLEVTKDQYRSGESIDLSIYPSGAYIIQIHYNGSVGYKRVLLVN